MIYGLLNSYIRDKVPRDILSKIIAAARAVKISLVPNKIISHKIAEIQSTVKQNLETHENKTMRFL